MKKIFQMQAIALVATLFSLVQVNAQNWALAGNAPANANSFVGTTNAQALRFRANNVEQMVLLTDGKFGIGTATPTAHFQVDNAALFSTAALINQTVNSALPTIGLHMDCTNNGAGAERAGYFRARGTLGVNTGLWAVAENGGTNYALYGLAGTATAGGSSYGTWGRAASVAGTTAYGVYGETTGGGTNWAGFFNGRAHVAGRLGVGTTTPAAMLQVAGLANEDALGVSVSGVLKLQVRSNGGVNVGSGALPPVDGLFVNGRTGLGIAAPTARLHVSTITTGEDAVNVTILQLPKFQVRSNGGVNVGSGAAAPPVDGLFVHGRTGLGTSLPNSKLHIAVAANEDPLNVTIGGAGKLQVRTNGGVNVGSGVFMPPANGLYVNGSTGLGTSSPVAKLHVVGDADDEAVIIRTSDDVTRFKVTSNGGVSIGTSHQATTNGLIVGDKVLINYADTAAVAGYMLAVNGKVVCEELRVKLHGTWPDYVFAADYRLPKLAEIEAFISENGHLPGIPSAAVVEKNGHDVGEMNRLLLEKVEQLTLHLIALEKELTALKK